MEAIWRYYTQEFKKLQTFIIMKISMLIEKIRVRNFRALRSIEVNLEPLTLLVGANNAGKTTFLRALNSVLGVSRSLLNRDDLFIDQRGNCPANHIDIDIKN